MVPYDLRCEYQSNPLGIDVAIPRFCWKLKSSSSRNVLQSARCIRISEDKAFARLLWESGKVISRESVHVEYAGPALKPRTRYFWQVQTWDDRDNSGGWSEAAWFETGKLGEDWQARWINAEGGSSRAVCPLLRREFMAEGPVRAARIYACAKGVYRLWINGSPVGDWLMTPGWTAYSKRLLYQTYDISEFIQPGENVIGAMVGNGWYAGDLTWLKKPAGYVPPDRELLLELSIEYADGRTQTVSTDKNWQAAEGPLLFSEIYHGEVYDARLEIPSWNVPGIPGGAWRSVAEPCRTVPGSLTAQDGPPVRRASQISPVEMIRTKSGETILDMGQNMVGFVRFRVKGNPGDRVVLKHCEVLDSDGNAYFANLRSARQTVEYILKGGGEEEKYEPFFSFQGFRYVQVAKWPGEPDISCFTGVVAHSDMEPTGSFFCNEELVNQLQHNILWSQKGNFFDVPTDCPQRDERLGWTDDAQVFIATACFNYQTAPFYTKWLRDMAAEQFASGGIPFVIPAVVEGDSSPAWNDAATICPWTLYEYYADKRVLEECYPMMKRWVEYIRSISQDGVLWNTGSHFGDWLALDSSADAYVGATPKDLIGTAYFAHSTELLAQVAEILGRGEDAAQYRELYRRIVRAFRNEFVTPNGRIVCPTQTAQALSLRFGLLDKPARLRAAGMLKTLLDERDGHLSTGFVGTPCLCQALTDSGMHEEACALVMKRDCPSWLYPVIKGATTIWEHWDGIKPDGSFWSADMNSFNHYAYGSIGDWLYRNILGIAPDPDEPGFRNVLVKPLPGGEFTCASGSLKTLYGEVAIAWKLSDGRFSMDLSIPENATATVVLPKAGKYAVTESGIPLIRAEGITGIRCQAGVLSFSTGSGQYRFEYNYCTA